MNEQGKGGGREKEGGKKEEKKKRKKDKNIFLVLIVINQILSVLMNRKSKWRRVPLGNSKKKKKSGSNSVMSRKSKKKARLNSRRRSRFGASSSEDPSFPPPLPPSTDTAFDSEMDVIKLVDTHVDSCSPLNIRPTYVPSEETDSDEDCSICTEKMLRKRQWLVVWGCNLHNTHRECARNVEDTVYFSCPLCRVPTNKNSMITSRNLIPTLEQTVYKMKNLPRHVTKLVLTEDTTYRPHGARDQRFLYLNSTSTLYDIDALVQVILSKPHIRKIYVDEVQYKDIWSSPLCARLEFESSDLCFSKKVSNFMHVLKLRRLMLEQPLLGSEFGSSGVTVYVCPYSYKYDFDLYYGLLNEVMLWHRKGIKSLIVWGCTSGKRVVVSEHVENLELADLGLWRINLSAVVGLKKINLNTTCYDANFFESLTRFTTLESITLWQNIDLPSEALDYLTTIVSVARVREVSIELCPSLFRDRDRTLEFLTILHEKKVRRVHMINNCMHGYFLTYVLPYGPWPQGWNTEFFDTNCEPMFDENGRRLSPPPEAEEDYL